ncbi:MAG TPA: hypothetical protein VKU37_09330 [Verrucomicrobiae bacterium]|nr:hypothetical protein [Verrucomicrobiae bacterium]
MKTATLSSPPRPPGNGNFAGGLGEPGGGGRAGRRAIVRRWCRMGLKFVAAILFVMAAAQLAFVLFQTVRLWFFS